MTRGPRPRGARRFVVALAAAGALGGGVAASQLGPADAARADEAAADGVAFLDPLTNEPLAFDLRPDQAITPAVEAFHATGENPYRGDPEAVAAGQKLWLKWCQACHLKDATGRIGPNLVDETYRYPRTETDVGLFEVVYAGAAGAMQAFGNRMDQDEILRVIAFIDSLRAEQ